MVRLVLQKRRDLLRCKGKKTPHYEKKKNSSQPNKKLRASSKNRISGGSPVELVDERESQKVYMISTLTTLHSGKTSLAEKKGFAQNKGKKTPHNEKKNSSQQNDKLRANRKKGNIKRCI